MTHNDNPMNNKNNNNNKQLSITSYYIISAL